MVGLMSCRFKQAFGGIHHVLSDGGACEAGLFEVPGHNVAIMKWLAFIGRVRFCWRSVREECAEDPGRQSFLQRISSARQRWCRVWNIGNFVLRQQI